MQSLPHRSKITKHFNWGQILIKAKSYGHAFIWGHNNSSHHPAYKTGDARISYFEIFVGLPANALLARLCVIFCKSATNPGSPKAQPCKVASVKAFC